MRNRFFHKFFIVLAFVLFNVSCLFAQANGVEDYHGAELVDDAIHSAWFKVLTVLVAIAAGWGVYKYRSIRVEKRSRLLEEQVKEQTLEMELKNTELQQRNKELNERQEEIELKNQQLEEQKFRLERVYQDMSTLNTIGQAITSELQQEEMITTLYHRVNLMMNVEGFGIGVYYPEEDEVVFRGYIEKEEVLPDHASPYNPEVDLSSWCIANQEPVFINNLGKEYGKYIDSLVDIIEGEDPLSLIYVPLVMKNGQKGVVTVQNFQANAYRPKDLALLRSLAVYISIALTNTENYREMQEIGENVQYQNRKIMDSLRYAETIQHTILPLPKVLEDNFSDHFVIYQSKDVVSGDFYWFTKVGVHTFMVVVDCTGHGVPGAFMSLIGYNSLDRLIQTERLKEPAEILEKMHKLVNGLLQQEEQLNNDSMDIGICRFSPTDKEGEIEVLFSGARRPLWIVNELGALVEIKGTRRSIGGWSNKEHKSFEQHQLFLPKGTPMYLFTDGLADQHNHANQKFSTAYLNKAIRELSSLPMAIQKEELKRMWDSFRGDTHQRDDVTLVGWRI